MAYQFVDQQDATIKYYPSGNKNLKAELTLSGLATKDDSTGNTFAADLVYAAIGDLLAIAGASSTYTPTNSYRTLEQAVTQGA